MYHYTVRCEFPDTDGDLMKRWVSWLVDSHLQDVLNAGATNARILQMRSDVPVLEVRYEFESQKTFLDYEANHAPRLREEGLEKFPSEELGMKFSRSDGWVFYTA